MSNTNNNIRSEIKLVAQVIETLAQQVTVLVSIRVQILFLLLTNWLATPALSFSLWALFMQRNFLVKLLPPRVSSRKTTVVSNPNQTNPNYFNHRDSLGRFARV